MVNIDAFVETARGRGLQLSLSSGALRVAQPDLGRLLDMVAEAGLVVVGVEAFRHVEGKVVPDVDLIADLSDLSGQWTRRVRESTTAAKRIVREWHDHFDFAEVAVVADVAEAE